MYILFYLLETLLNGFVYESKLNPEPGLFIMQIEGDRPIFPLKSATLKNSNLDGFT